MTPAFKDAPAFDARDYAPLRAVDPATTLARVGPSLRSLGITRIANITGLDRLGLPVVNVVRPNARSNAVSQGKGLDLNAAKASGVMEAIETYCAERVMKPVLLASAEEMARAHRLPDLSRLPRPAGSRWESSTPILWMEGRQVDGGEAIWVPFELVHMNMSVPAAPGSGHFLLSSNGLASGNNFEEALNHGICELIERDSSALFDCNPRLLDERRLDLATIGDPYCLAIVDRMRAAGLAVAIWDMTSNVGIPAFRCHLMEPPVAATVVQLPAGGEGCHPRRDVALLRAIAEAAQARLSVIAGVRDDIGPELYGRSDDPAELEAWWHTLSDRKGRQRFDRLPDARPLDPGAETSYLIGSLARAGLASVIWIDLSPPEIEEIVVGRVIIPGLEPPTEAQCMPGPRADAAMARFG